MQQTARPDYAQVGLLKTALTASSTAFQIPMALLAERFGEVAMLAMGMAWVGAGFMVLGLAGSFVHTLLLMVVAGTGGSVQHPVASSFISREYEGRRRGSASGSRRRARRRGTRRSPLFARRIGRRRLSCSLRSQRARRGHASCARDPESRRAL